MLAHRHNENHRSGQVPRGLLLGALVAAVMTAGAAPSGRGVYRMSPTSPGSLARYRAELGPDRFAALLAVNRVDMVHAVGLDSLVVPPEGRELLELAPFPATLARTDSLPTLLIVSARIQAFAAYDSGRIVRWGPISSGGPESPTPTGEYRANWKARRHVSTFDSTWIMPWCVNLDGELGTALHAYSLPGRPASHCCIRLVEADARWIHDWIVVRVTPVIILDAYDFDAPAPWRLLPADPAACDVPEEVIEAAITTPGHGEAVGVAGH